MARKALAEQYKTSTNLEARILLHEQYSINEQRWPVWLFDQFEIASHSEVLDLGCGVGKIWQVNQGLIGEGWSAVLGDFSMGMIAKAKKNLAEVGGKFNFAVMEAGTAPFEDGRFDVVIATHILYHVSDLGRTLADIRRVLKPGGILYVSTNGVRHMAELDALIPEGMPFKPMGEVIKSFTLENGAEQLRPFFERVKLRRHIDGLAVTEVRPLMDYALSRLSIFSDGESIEDGVRQRFIEQVEWRIAEHDGVIEITKDSGLFIAHRPFTHSRHDQKKI